ncbi:MAG: hypothetical protein V7731_09455 [Amphritea sp.]
MIVFTITNTLTDQVYVGTTRDSIDSRLQQILAAMESGLEAGLYTDIRKHGAENFDIAEWAEAEDIQELRDLTRDAIETYSAISLQGLRTKESVPQLNKIRATATKRTTSSTAAPTASSAAASILASRAASTSEQRIANHSTVNTSADETPILPTGRVSSPAQEKKIREAIAAEKDAMQLERNAKEKAASAEMALLMARIDARGKKPKKATKSSSSVRKSTAANKTTSSVESAADTLKLSIGRVSSSAKEKQIREAIAQEKDARLEEKIAKQKAEATEMAMIMARIDARKAPKKVKAAAAKSTIIKKRSTVADAPKSAVKITSDRAQLTTASIHALTQKPKLTTTTANSLTQKPKLGSGRLSSSAREQKIREAIANEKAARQAEKLSQQAAQASDMAAIIARLDARAKTVKKR